MDIFDILVICMGLYVMWAAWQLKTEGKINRQVMRSPNKDAKTIKDLEGFQKFVFPKCMLVGVLVVVLGIFGLVREYAPVFETNGAVGAWIETIAIIAVIVVLFWYAHVIHVAEKKFY